jgi:hypothetical protein
MSKKKTTGKVAVDFLILNNECISINHLILPWLSELPYSINYRLFFSETKDGLTFFILYFSLWINPQM